MLVKIPGTDKWINPTYVISVSSWKRYNGSGRSTGVTRIETLKGHEETMAPIEEVLAALKEE